MEMFPVLTIIRSAGSEESEVKLVDPYAGWVTVIEGAGEGAGMEVEVSPLPDCETYVVIGG
jgi:hypothetical protein